MLGRATTKWQEHNSIRVRRCRGEGSQSGRTLTVQRGHWLQSADVAYHERTRQQAPTKHKYLCLNPCRVVRPGRDGKYLCRNPCRVVRPGRDGTS